MAYLSATEGTFGVNAQVRNCGLGLLALGCGTNGSAGCWRDNEREIFAGPAFEL